MRRSRPIRRRPRRKSMHAPSSGSTSSRSSPTSSASNMTDEQWMARAIALGEEARGTTAPNPNVGCVIVRDGTLLAEGATEAGGRPHAEAIALAAAGEQARGATLYVTLEPCAHESPRGPA